MPGSSVASLFKKCGMRASLLVVPIVISFQPSVCCWYKTIVIPSAGLPLLVSRICVVTWLMLIIFQTVIWLFCFARLLQFQFPPPGYFVNVFVISLIFLLLICPSHIQ